MKGENSNRARRARYGVVYHMALAVLAVMLLPGDQILASDPPATSTGSATLSLEEVLKLYRDRAQEPEDEAPPPVDAVVQKLDLRGRVLEDSLEVHAAVQIKILRKDRWVSVALLDVDDATRLVDVPDIDGAALAVVDGQLHLIARRSGRFEFEVGVASQAVIDGTSRTASISVAAATFVRCRLGFDATLFEPDASTGDVQGDLVTVTPRGNRFDVKWRHRSPPRPTGQATGAAPEAEPVIPTAHASVVSTLEGEHLLRAAYTLRFTGRKPITFDLPPGHRLIRAYLNARPVPVVSNDQQVSFEVFAARAGQAGGSLELVLAASGRDYLLSGRLPLVLPRPSWRINELYLSAHLPNVFDYTWTNGTLSPVERSPATQFVFEIPTPGKRLHFRQFLVHRSTPALTLEYAVSLDGHYFKPDVR